jgi:glucosamine-phosphate N-acetyltransferase
MELIIRNIKENDIDFVIEMLQDISLFEPQKSERQGIFNEFISQSNVLGFVYLLGNTIVGYGSLVFETKIRSGRVGHIEDIVVNRNFRKKNIGFKIIHHLIDESRIRKCYKVSLVCKENNVSFYKKCGLVVDGTSMSELL